MVLVVNDTEAQACIETLNGLGENAWRIGHIIEKSAAEAVKFIS